MADRVWHLVRLTGFRIYWDSRVNTQELKTLRGLFKRQIQNGILWLPQCFTQKSSAEAPSMAVRAIVLDHVFLRVHCTGQLGWRLSSSPWVSKRQAGPCLLPTRERIPVVLCQSEPSTRSVPRGIVFEKVSTLELLQTHQQVCPIHL